MEKSTPAALAALLQKSRRAAALTGAGISVESGIPAFRGAQGLWSRYDPVEYAHIRAFMAHPAKVWTMLKELDATIRAARPNPAHTALAELERLGKLAGIITQNVDNLHQEAGSANVIEYHGNAHHFVCHVCRGHWPREALDFDQTPLYCYCGGLIRPDVVFFGEAIPEDALRQAHALAAGCDLMLVIGTSAAVYPAAGLPYTAKDAGAAIVEINLEPTDLTDKLTDYFLSGSASNLLSATVAALHRLGAKGETSVQ